LKSTVEAAKEEDPLGKNKSRSRRSKRLTTEASLAAKTEYPPLGP